MEEDFVKPKMAFDRPEYLNLDLPNLEIENTVFGLSFRADSRSNHAVSMKDLVGPENSF